VTARKVSLLCNNIAPLRVSEAEGLLRLYNVSRAPPFFHGNGIGAEGIDPAARQRALHDFHYRGKRRCSGNVV